MYCTRYIHFSVPTDTGYRIYQTVHSTADSSVCFSYNLPVNWLFNCMNNRKFKASDNSLCVGILWVPQRTFQQYAKNARSENARGLHILNSSSCQRGGEGEQGTSSPSPSSSVAGLAERGDVTCDKNLPRLPATSAVAAASLLLLPHSAALCLASKMMNVPMFLACSRSAKGGRWGTWGTEGSREPAVSVVSTYPGLHSGKLLASVATRFDESFAAAKLSPFSDY